MARQGQGLRLANQAPSSPFPTQLQHPPLSSKIVKALYYLKEKHGVIHRDVKPSNILLDERGQIKLCDFGISGRLVDSKAKTRSAGCAAYMAVSRGLAGRQPGGLGGAPAPCPRGPFSLFNSPPPLPYSLSALTPRTPPSQTMTSGLTCGAWASPW